MLEISVLPKLVFLIFETESEVEGQEKMAHYHNDYKVRPFSFLEEGHMKRIPL